MITFLYVLIVLFPAVAVGAMAYLGFRQRRRGVAGKKILLRNLLAFALVLAVSCAMALSVSAAQPAAQPAEEAAVEQQAEPAPAADSGLAKGLGLIAAALVTSLAGIGGGIAVAAGAPAAIAAAAENAASFGKSLIFVALGESIALYGVVISILILNKI